MTNFKELLEQSKQLTNHISAPGLVPLERGLEQIDSQTKRLLKRSKADKLDTRTAYMLAKKGFDAERVAETLDSINLAHTFEPLVAVPDTDIEAFLTNEHENMVSLAIEETKNSVMKDFESSLSKNFISDWEQTKKKILQKAGHTATHETFDTFKRDVELQKTSITGNNRFKAYFSVVENLNQHILRGQEFDVVKSFSSQMDGVALDNQQQFIRRCWDLVGSIKKRSQESIVKGGREWLEKNFCQWVSDQTYSHRAEVGGMPSIHSEVDALLKLLFMRSHRWTLPWLDLSIGKTPFWAHVYYLVRMGHRKEALQYIKKHQHELSPLDKHFPAYFEAWTDNGLPKHLRDSLLTDWNSSIRDYMVDPKVIKGDVFKYTLYKLIGRCELNVKTIRNNDVISTTDDYLWVQFMLIQDSDLSYDRYTLADFSSRMEHFGLTHFKTVPVWFMVLLLCGEYEMAVDELLKDQFLALDALHFAIALAYKGLLRVPENPRLTPSAGLLSKKQELNFFHFSRMIINFVKEWLSEPTQMLQYVYLIGLYGKDHGVSTKEYLKVAHSAIREIILSSGQFSTLLGQVRADGSGRIPGHVENHAKLVNLTAEDYIETIVVTCGHEAHTQGRLLDAIQLFHLAGQYNRVIDLLNHHLGEILLKQNLSDIAQKESKSKTDHQFPDISLDRDPIDAASQLLKFYMSRPLTCSQITKKAQSTLQTLIELYRFRDLIDQSREEAALSVLYELQVLPISTDMVEIQRKADSFNALDECVTRVLPNTMLLAAQALYNLFRAWSHRRGDFGDAAREARVKEIRSRSKALLMFAGLIQFRIPSDVFAKLNRIDVMMG